MPINTTLRMRVTRLATNSCSKISPLVRSPMMPIVPVAQNVQPIAHPTWEKLPAPRTCTQPPTGCSAESLAQAAQTKVGPACV